MARFTKDFILYISFKIVFALYRICLSPTLRFFSLNSMYCCPLKTKGGFTIFLKTNAVSPSVCD